MINIKCIHITQNLDDSFGGPPKSIPYLCHSLNELNVETQLVSIKLKDNEFNSVISKFNLKWNSFTYMYLEKLMYSRGISKYVELQLIPNKKTIMHVHNAWNYIPYMVYMLYKNTNVPYIISARGSFYDWSLKQGRLQKFFSWHIFQKSMLNDSACVHATEINELKALQKLGVTAPIALIPNGVNLTEFLNLGASNQSKINLSLDTSKEYILFISRVHEKKGIEFLINAFAKLSEKFSKYNLIIVGPIEDIKYKNKLDKILKVKKLATRVEFLGMLDGQDRLDAYNCSKLFVLPSHTENFGMVIAEAMAAKLPVITTHGTPWQEIEEYNAGWWVELSQDNIDKALEDALSLEDKELKQKGINGFELIKKYEWKYQAKKMKKVYEWILNAGEKPSFVYEIEDI